MTLILLTVYPLKQQYDQIINTKQLQFFGESAESVWNV